MDCHSPTFEIRNGEKMVEFQESMMDGDKEDVMATANGYRACADDDTRKVLNLMSDRTTNELESFKFYIVPSSWFLAAWPLLNARTPDNVQGGWREQIGRIQNAELLINVEREVSSSSEEEGDDKNMNMQKNKKRLEKFHRRREMRNSSRPRAMKKGLVHERDYFVLGPSAWTLVKSKFGDDGYEIARPCVAGKDNSLAIELLPEESEGTKPAQIEIPPSGRFAYERIVNGENPISKTALVPEDEGHNVTWGDSTSDEKNESTTKAAQDEPVLLLPPSATAVAAAVAASGSGVYTSNDDMDLESGASEKGSIVSPSLSGRKRLASGLGNLGNTCFMNSTLQCLAHTDPLRRYFLSGEYERDLNRDNPLGTGGELATQFANLIREMWGVSAKRRNVLGTNDSHFLNSSSSAVYPRSFKYCLGKHAEQFMGYDQHDSQELATYLLDALHEDTNRVTKKPYIEKPEQGDDEPDDIASSKAWDLHLQREDSKVLEYFMGQVKSRLECNEKNRCKRISTTFDPFMYLSVPIPGATDRTLKVTFIPLDPSQRMKNVSITINKAASMPKLMQKLNEELVTQGFINEPIPLDNLCPVDFWSHEIFSWHKKEEAVDKIRDSDHTYVYQLQSMEEIREMSDDKTCTSQEELTFGETKTKQRFGLDIETLTKLNKDDEWRVAFEDYVQQEHLLYALLNPKRQTLEEKMTFHRKLERFIDNCHTEISEGETTGLKRGREERESESGTKSDLSVSPSEETIQGLVDRCDTSRTFCNVRTRHDVAILEFIAKKLRQFILKLVNDKRHQNKDGILVTIIMKRPQNGSMSSHDHPFAHPMILRLPSNMTVHGLRKELATILSRSLQGNNREATGNARNGNHDHSFGSPELNTMLQIPLTCYKKSPYSSTKSCIGDARQLGMLAEDWASTYDNGGRSAVYAKETDEAEQALIADVVGNWGQINLDWPYELCDREFDLVEYEAIDEPKSDIDASIRSEKQITVLDCIEKYCQREQLEETEMWYCSRCKEHVRAWKQFYLYRVPPILIVHLKRFHYSATTHRRDKITSVIDFPLKGLDLRGMVAHYAEDEKPIYDLYAVSNHYGGLGGGHYTAYILSDDGSWNHYDDSRVTSNIDPKDVVSEAAYVLYYRRRDLPVVQDNFVDEIAGSPMVYDQPDNVRDSSEVSSNNTAQAGDDDMAIDGDGSSRTCSSPMGSIDGDHDPANSGGIVSFVTDQTTGNEDEGFPSLPLQ